MNAPPHFHVARFKAVTMCAALGLALVHSGCSRDRDGANPEARADRGRNELVLTFTYGSEKQKWLDDVTSSFHATRPRTAAGRPIRVEAIPIGSGELVEDLLAERRQAHLASPASGVFVTLGNAESRARTGSDLFGRTESLVLSPVVVAMWKPMAEALGWGRKPIGWRDLLDLARNPRGWAALGHPEWGSFRFGHTHPRYSNSGLISVLAEVYAATGKTAGLTVGDVQRPEVGAFVGGIERAVVHYGSSTGFFGRRLYSEGPGYLSAAVLYENMVIESYRQTTDLPFPLVAIYPHEGTFWSDHPIGIVQREWVTPEHQEGAQAYVRFLLAGAQQQRALDYGFRPAELSIAVGTPIDASHGVDPVEPKTTLEVPTAEVVHAALAMWESNKKLSDVVLALDISGSMNDQGKWPAARDGAKTFLSLLGDEDRVSVLAFSHQVRWLCRGSRLGEVREQLVQQLDGMFANGGTALFDAIVAGLDHLKASGEADRIQAVVVLSDGDDRDSRFKRSDLHHRLSDGGETESVRVFTIGYGTDARADVLKDIAERTRARFDTGKPDTIREVFKDISSFF